MQFKLAVLLPTYNGGKFLAEQLDSLLGQSYKNLVIVIRDDGSVDGTREIIQSYSEKFPLLIRVIEDDGRNLGASNSFSFLINYVLEHKQQLGMEHAYMMFCDQDDVWADNKVELEMNSMVEIEAGEITIPVLIHSDLRVVSESRDLIADSFIGYQGLVVERNKFGQVLLSNLVTGCTALINEALARKALPISSSAIMHDWWLALVATAFGRTVFIPESLVDYRQHEQNTIGARQYIKRKILSVQTVAEFINRKQNKLLVTVAEQAQSFLNQFGQELSFKQKMRLRFTMRLRSRSILVQRFLFRLLRY